MAATAGAPLRRAPGGAEAPAGGRLWCGARVGSGERECARAGARRRGPSASNSLRREFEGNSGIPFEGNSKGTLNSVRSWKYYASCRAHPATITLGLRRQLQPGCNERILLGVCLLSLGLELRRLIAQLLRCPFGTTTTGSSLVHCKLYWVPARAALRLGSDARLSIANR